MLFCRAERGCVQLLLNIINKLAPPLFVKFKTGTNFVLRLYINTAAIVVCELLKENTE